METIKDILESLEKTGDINEPVMTKWQSFKEGIGFGVSSEAIKVYSRLTDEEVKCAAFILIKIYDDVIPKLPFSLKKWHRKRRVWRRILSIIEDMKRRGWGKVEGNIKVGT